MIRRWTQRAIGILVLVICVGIVIMAILGVVELLFAISRI